MSEKDIYERNPEELFWDYCSEPDERKAIDIKDELFDGIVSLHTQELPGGGMYYEYLPEDVFVCCEKMRAAGEEHTLEYKAAAVEPIGTGKRWYAKCPFCSTAVVITEHSVTKRDEDA